MSRRNEAHQASPMRDPHSHYVHNLLMRIEQLEGEVKLAKASASPKGGSRDDIASSVTSESLDRIVQESPILPQESELLVTPPASMSTSTELLPLQPSQEKNWRQDGPNGTRSNTKYSYSPPETVEQLAQGYLGDASCITFLHTLIKDKRDSRQKEQNESINLLYAKNFASNKLVLNPRSIIDSWPQRHIGDHLVECYMELCYPQYPFIYGPAFRKRYESMWTSKEPQSDAWVAKVNTVFALGCQFSPKVSSQMGEEFFKKAKSLINFDILGSSNLETLQALILMSVYLQSSASLNISWNVISITIRMAQSLGLHLRKTYKASWTPLSREIRKRAWWACYILDSVSGIMLGRPQMISEDSFHSLDLPERVNDEFFLETDPSLSTENVSKSNNTGGACELDFFIATIQLSQFMREISKAYDNPFDHSKMLDIDDRLCRWIANVPPHLRHDSNIVSNRKLWRQKVVLTVRFLNFRVVLHRACVSQEQSTDSNFGPFDSVRDSTNSRLMSLRSELCSMTAVKIIQHISSFYAEGLNGAWWYDLNHVFAASSIIVVQILRQRNIDYYNSILDLAISVMRGMQESGKPLAGQYLRMLEKLQQTPTGLERESLSKDSASYLPYKSYGSSSMHANTSSGSQENICSTLRGETPHETIQDDLDGNIGLPSVNGSNEIEDIDVNSLFESLSFPWSLHYNSMPSEEEYANILFAQTYDSSRQQ
ncbi:hypothetical protein B7463_g7715, partial [Scytalidium lignicola]